MSANDGGEWRVAAARYGCRRVRSDPERYVGRTPGGLTISFEASDDVVVVELALPDPGDALVLKTSVAAGSEALGLLPELVALAERLVRTKPAPAPTEPRATQPVPGATRELKTLRATAAQREIERATERHDDFVMLHGYVGTKELPPKVRAAAMRRLLGLFPLDQIASIKTAHLRGLAAHDFNDDLRTALGAPPFAGTRVRLIVGLARALGGGELHGYGPLMHYVVANAKITKSDRGWLGWLIEGEDRELAGLAATKLSRRHSLDELAAIKDAPWLNHVEVRERIADRIVAELVTGTAAQPVRAAALRLLEDPKWTFGSTRTAQVVPWLGRYGDPASLGFLVRALSYGHEEIDSAVTRSLLQLPIAPATILEALTPPSRDRVLAAAPEVASDTERLQVATFAAFLAAVPSNKPALVRKYLDALAEVGTAAEAPIVARFADASDDHVQRAAIAALGAIGDLASIPALEPLTIGIFRGPSVKAQAKKAIADIVGRIGADGRGGLTLSEHDRGALTLTKE